MGQRKRDGYVMAEPIETKRNDDDLLAITTEFMRHGLDTTDEWRERARKSQKYYNGDQWSEADLAKLRAEGRPHLTINHIKRVVNFLSGVQRQASRDFRVLPRRGGVGAVAQIYTALLKHTNDLSNGHHQQSEAFRNGVETGKGYLALNLDFDADPFSGQLMVESVTPFDVFEDTSDHKYDLNTAKYVIRRRWVDAERLKAELPKKKREELEANPSAKTTTEDTPADDLVNALLTGVDDENYEEDDDFSAMRRHRYPVLEIWWREPQKRCFLYNLQTGETTSYNKQRDNLEARRAKLLAQEYPDEYQYKERVVNVVNLTRRVGNVVIQHVDDAMFGLDIIPIFRFVPFFNEGKAMGVVDDLRDLQDEENKRRSQVLHLLNQTANGGWIVEDGSNEAAMLELEEFGSKPGIALDKSKYGGSLERIEPASLSQGHFLLSQQASEDMKTVSGIVDALMGIEAGEEESGVLNAQRQRQGMTVLEIVFDRFDTTLQYVAQAMLDVIRATGVYTNDEIRRIVDESEMLDTDLLEQSMQQMAQQVPPPPAPPPQLVVRLAPEEKQMAAMAYQEAMRGWKQRVMPQARQLAIDMALEQMSNKSVARYSVAVTTSAAAPTKQIANFAELSQIAQQFPGAIPPDVLVKASSLPSEMKDDVIQRLQAAQAQVQQQ